MLLQVEIGDEEQADDERRAASLEKEIAANSKP